MVPVGGGISLSKNKLFRAFHLFCFDLFDKVTKKRSDLACMLRDIAEMQKSHGAPEVTIFIGLWLFQI